MASRKAKPSSTGKAITRPANAGNVPIGYGELLDDLKARIRAAQVKAALSVNRELIVLYWHIGRSIVERQRAEGWGKAVVERLADDLGREFPGLSGFSAANIWRMRAFYLGWADEILAQPVRELKRVKLAQAARELESAILKHTISEIPWGHNIVLLQKLKYPAVRLWYARPERTRRDERSTDYTDFTDFESAESA